MDKNEIIKNFQLASTKHKKGKVDNAIKILKKILKNNPNEYNSIFLLGSINAQIKNYNEAINLLKKSIEINPNIADAHNNLGLIYMLTGDLKKSLLSLNQAIKIKPDYSAAYCNLGLLKNKLEKLDEAINHFKKSIEINPKDLVSHFNLGNLYKKKNNILNAESCYLESIKINASYFSAYNNLMDLYEKTNQRKKLINIIKKGEEYFNNNSTFNLFNAKNFFNIKKYQEAIDILENLEFNKLEISKEQTKNVILAKSYDKLKKFDKAYNYFNRANKISLNANIKVYKRKRTIEIIKNRINFFSNLKKNHFYNSNISEEKSPIFLIGFPRSGTTLLDTILRSHPSIDVLEEKPIVEKWLSNINDNFNDNLDYLNLIEQKNMSKIQNLYFDLRNKNLDNFNYNKTYIDKMPLNIIYVGEIVKIFPKAKFLFALRHPCDCVLSCFMQSFEINDAMSNFFNLKDTSNLYSSIMNLWEIFMKKLSLNVHIIKYENLINNFDDSIKKTLKFVDMDWSDDVLNFYKTAETGRIINTPSYDQVNKPIYKTSIEKWKNYENQIKEVFPILEPWIKKFDYKI